MLKKVVAGVLIIAGIITLSYPKLKETYENHLQSQLLNQWKQSSVVAQADTQVEAVVKAASASPDKGAPNQTAAPTRASEPAAVQTPAAAQAQPEAEEETAPDDPLLYDPLLIEFMFEDESADYDPDAEYIGPVPEYDELLVDGILGIEGIDLELPVIKGVTNSNLRISVASFTNGGAPGGWGNYSIAGHRNRQYGRNFNRLNEVEEGDIVTMTTKTDRYEYTVVEKLFVDPDAVWVLDGEPDVKEITLITCHPMGNPTGRLIIKGRILDGEKPAQ